MTVNEERLLDESLIRWQLWSYEEFQEFLVFAYAHMDEMRTP
jgi:hypothetical protein